MVNKRLVWFLEANNVLTELQSGFQKNRSTTDQLVRLEKSVREAFACREHVVAVFFDLEKAPPQDAKSHHPLPLCVWSVIQSL
jgi:hypothetical protein